MRRSMDDRNHTVVIDDSDDEFMLVGFADEQDGEYTKNALHFHEVRTNSTNSDVSHGMDHVYIDIVEFKAEVWLRWH